MWRATSQPSGNQLHTPVAVTDAAIFGRIHSCAVVVYCPATLRRVGFSMYYEALDCEPVVPETMARLLLLHVLWNWCGQVWVAADCVSTLLRIYTRMPRKETIMGAIFRSLASVLRQVHIQELWVEARSMDVLSLLNAQAHTMARAGARQQSHHEVPLAAHLCGRLALFY